MGSSGGAHLLEGDKWQGKFREIKSQFSSRRGRSVREIAVAIFREIAVEMFARSQ
jgi:hypothetical protein